MSREQIEARRQALRGSSDLEALRARLDERAAQVLERPLIIPEHKALLSADGGVCPEDGRQLAFDPWSPSEHRCRRCGKTFRGERHDRHWARFQHLWLAERAAHLATLAALTGREPAAARAREILTGYAERYLRYPNRDNVLGPSRLFFSTYLESIWILNYLAAALLLRESDAMDDATSRAVAQVADEAANLIGDFDEGFSNRQTWNNAALVAIAAWFEDEDLARTAIEGAAGLMAHIRGFRDDGMWYEGENYHLFAIRGLVTGAAWARVAGADFFAEPALRARLETALLAPSLTALPDLTFPARKDSRFGVSLTQPMYLETWEVALGLFSGGEQTPLPADVVRWVRALYRAPAQRPELFDSYLHDAPAQPLPAPRCPARSDLSWWALLEMLPELPGEEEPWTAPSVLLRGQGLAVLRNGSRYVSLDCGPLGGGHGHPDRLHLTLHAAGVHWLRDVGTGSYVTGDLFWYRSPLAHNVPIVDGGAGAWDNAVCERFDVRGEWAWVRGRVDGVTRTVISGPSYLLDIVELTGEQERTVDVPWHLGGAKVDTPGRWEPGSLASEFLTDVARFVPEDPAMPLVAHASQGTARLTVHFPSGVELWRAVTPGVPGEGAPEPTLMVRARGRNVRLVTLLETHDGTPVTRAVRASGDVVEVDTAGHLERHETERDRWLVRNGGNVVSLEGPVEMEVPFRPLLDLEPQRPVACLAYVQDVPPALDGTLTGFDTSSPLQLDLEDQYRRSEEPYAGPDELSATAYVGWDSDALYVAVDVTKPELCLRPRDAQALRLDNDPDDIHSDGLQLFVRAEGSTDAPLGFLIVPEEPGGSLRIRVTSGAAGDPGMVRGAWRRTEGGYCVTVSVAAPPGLRPAFGTRIAFDLIVNEMLPGRTRRAGQLVWSGGNGWVWLRSDRQDPRRFGVLELVG
ncbi:MAG TPA: heparinase II/III family protein [Gemmatimonadales bacterium]